MVHGLAQSTRIGRRDLLKRSAVLVVVPVDLVACTERADPAADAALLTDIAGLLIPATDTPGGAAVGAGAAALKAIGVGMDDATPAMVGAVRVALDRAAGGTYLGAADTVRIGALRTVDARAFAASAPDATDTAWRKIKALLLLGYYTSEAGSSQELRYELVPGRYDPDLPATPATRAISSDWFAVSFR